MEIGSKLRRFGRTDGEICTEIGSLRIGHKNPHPFRFRGAESKVFFYLTSDLLPCFDFHTHAREIFSANINN
jgi:hypothetical protein